MPTSTMSMRYDSEHKKTLESMTGDRKKELEKLKAEAAAAATSQQTLAQKLDKATARKSILEQEVGKHIRLSFSLQCTFVQLCS